MCKLYKEKGRMLQYDTLRTKKIHGIIIVNGGVIMRDFPIFTTDFGVSSLTLKEIPYKNQAYICIRDVQPDKFNDHMAECVSFCRMAGAERIFACGHEKLKMYPLYTSIYQMKITASPSRDQVKNLFPVTKETVGKWRTIYNERMRGVDNAGTLEARDENRILNGGSYFVHHEGHLLGIGMIEGNTIQAMAAVEKGAGQTVMNTLLSLLDGETVTLEVASTNIPAIHLYERLGFLRTGLINTWYDISTENFI